MSASHFHTTYTQGAVRVVRLCAACAVRYAAAVLCDTCLRESDADPTRKRAILFPSEFADLA